MKLTSAGKFLLPWDVIQAPRDTIKLPLINARDRLAETSASQNYTSVQEVVSVRVRRQFRGLAGTYDLLNAARNMRRIGGYFNSSYERRLGRKHTHGRSAASKLKR